MSIQNKHTLKSIRKNSNNGAIAYSDDYYNEIEGSRRDDILIGTQWHDKIEGEEGNDQLFGLAGNDKLEGEEGNDLLVGGTGNDYLEGNEGSDTYRFSVGDGNDVVYDKDKKFWSSSSSTDVIEFTDVSSQDVSYQVAGPNLIIRYGNNDSIVVRNFQTSDGKIEQFKFTDRTLSYNDLLGVINGQGGQGGGGTQLPPIIDPPIQPENPNGVLPGNPGNRNQIIGTSRNDKLKGTYLDDYIYGGAGNDKIDGKDGNDLIYGGAGHDDIEGGRGDDIIYGGTGNDKIEGDEGNDQLFGEAGNDKLEGEEGNDLLVGGTGNDYLEGNEGSDTYRFSVGDGHDIVYDKDKKIWSSSTSTDVIEFTDVSSQDVSYYVSGPNLIIRYGNNDSIVVRNFQTSDGKIEQFKFTDRVMTYDDVIGTIQQQNRPFVLNSNPVLAEGNGTQELHSLLSAMSAFGVKTDSSVSVENTDTTSILTSGNYMLTSSSR